MSWEKCDTVACVGVGAVDVVDNEGFVETSCTNADFLVGLQC